MQRYMLRRFAQGIVALLGIMLLVFVLSRLSGDPIEIMLPIEASEADRVHMSKLLGLDEPYHLQFYRFIVRAVRGDLGESIRFRRPATQLFFERFGNSLKLVGAAFGFALMVAIPLAVGAASNRGKPIDTVAKVLAVAGMAAPTFLVGLILIMIFSVSIPILPAARMGGPEHYVLPAVTLGLFLIAGLVRLLRSSMLEHLDAEYVKLARIKGVSEAVILWKHVLRNALIPVVGFAGVYTAVLITGTIVVETIFAWPGVGRLAYQAVIARDYPLVQAVVMLKAVFVLLIMIVTDILYAYLDPRIRYR